MSDLKNIWNNKEELDEEALLRYLQGKSSESERHALEKQMLDSEFVNDAVEGLQDFSDSHKIEHYAKQLNGHLRTQTTNIHRKKNKNRLKNQHLTLLTLIAIITLCILAWWVLRLYEGR